jgi:hypothetical protein
MINRVSPPLIALLLSLAPMISYSQVKIEAVGGLSYIEHVSLGFRFQLNSRHSLSAQYGSNVLFSHYDFYNLIAQYDYSFKKGSQKNITPRLGVRGEDSYYTDTYYRWHVMNIIPFLGAKHQFNPKISFFGEVGVSISFLQSVTRIKMGEVGIYKQYLPEVKFGIGYTLYEKKK